MQDIYAFDVGDFGKLGLLRHLSQTKLTLGVLWYRTQSGSAGADGKHLAYLQNRRYRDCDPDLWDEMGRLLKMGKRTIAALCPLFPKGTLFNYKLVPRGNSRRAWFLDGMNTVASANIVFCDPNNGVTFKDACDSPRHVGLDEIRRLHDAGHSLVIYHHLNRSASHVIQIDRGLDCFSREFPALGGLWGAHYRRGSSRVFFVLAHIEHAAAIGDSMELMRSSPWTRGGDFEIVRYYAPRDVGGRRESGANIGSAGAIY